MDEDVNNEDYLSIAVQNTQSNVNTTSLPIKTVNAVQTDSMDTTNWPPLKEQLQNLHSKGISISGTLTQQSVDLQFLEQREIFQQQQLQQQHHQQQFQQIQRREQLCQKIKRKVQSPDKTKDKNQTSNKDKKPRSAASQFNSSEQTHSNNNRFALLSELDISSIDTHTIEKIATTNRSADNQHVANTQDQTTANTAVNLNRTQMTKNFCPPIILYNVDINSLLRQFKHKFPEVEIKIVNTTKNKSKLYVTCILTCNDHINGVVSKVFFILRRLRMSTDYLPEDVKCMLVKQLILPHITYSQLLYSKLDSRSQHKMEVAFNNATRFVFGLRKYDHVSRWKNKILGCGIVKLLEANNCMFLYKLMSTKCPRYLYDKLRFPLSSRSRALIIPPYVHLNTSRLFFINAVRLWNSLPLSIKTSLNERNFRQILFDYFSIV